MNALELADELEEFSGDGAFKYYLEIATMLRQQQAKLTKYELRHAEQRDRIAFLESQVYGGTTK